MTIKHSLGRESFKVYKSGLHRDLKKIIDGALEVCPVDFSLVDGKRTAKTQFGLFQIGRRYDHQTNRWVENGSGVVTYCDGYEKESKHQSGFAIDVAVYIPGRHDLKYDKIHMAVLIGSFLTVADMLYRMGDVTHGLRSGADWDRDTQFLEPGTFIDMPHLELIEP